MSDDRDLSWLGAATPAPPAYPEAVIWRVTKRRGVAEARVRDVPSGRELVLMVDRGAGAGFEMGWTILYRPGESAELASTSAGALADFEHFGWALVCESPTA